MYNKLRNYKCGICGMMGNKDIVHHTTEKLSPNHFICNHCKDFVKRKIDLRERDLIDMIDCEKNALYDLIRFVRDNNIRLIMEYDKYSKSTRIRIDKETHRGTFVNASYISDDLIRNVKDTNKMVSLNLECMLNNIKKEIKNKR